MRVGDFGVEVVAVHGDDIRELDSGHVLARAGAVYALRLRNYGPLRCVADIRIDGKPVTAGGLILDPFSAVTLERPINEREDGRFTVVAEGDESVFGPDGGRDNHDLGSIEGRFRRELPRDARRPGDARPLDDVRELPFPTVAHPMDLPAAPPRILPAPGRPMAPPEWSPPGWHASANSIRPDVSAIAADFTTRRSTPPRLPSDQIERAAGTGLTGHSTQRFVASSVGPLEEEATVIRLRLVIGTEEALAAARPLPERTEAPARPAARP